MDASKKPYLCRSLLIIDPVDHLARQFVAASVRNCNSLLVMTTFSGRRQDLRPGLSSDCNDHSDRSTVGLVNFGPITDTL
ncbi:MAG: hypothetical protein AB1508_06900 [Pseudomonadota bacterium]